MQRKERKGTPLGWIPLALVVWAVIFGVYEVVERRLFGGVSFDAIHILHILRGTLTSFLLAGLVAWYIIRRGVAREEEERRGRVISGSFWTVEGGREAELRNRLHWLILLRWVAITGVLFTLAFTTLVLKVLSVYSALAVGIIAAMMALYNLIFRLACVSTKAPKAMAFAQVLLDLMALTLMLHFTGGISNPFFAFFVFHVIIASILLKRQESYLVAAITCVLFSSIVLLEQFGLIRNYPLGLLAAQVIPVPGPASSPHPLLYVLGVLLTFKVTVFFSVYFATTIMGDLRRRQQELVEANELLGQEKSKLNDIVSSIGAGLLVFDRDRRAVWSNSKVQEWFGPSLEDAFCGLHCSQPEDCSTRVALEIGRTDSWKRTVTQGAFQRHFMITSSPIRDSRGRITHALELIQDITHIKEMEAQLMQAGKMVAVGQLASGIAHQLNNPLATVAASAEFLAGLAQDEKLAALKELEPFPRHLQRIEEHVYRCKEIIQSLLKFARKEEIELAEVPLNDVIEEAIHLLGQRGRSSDKKIQKDYGEGLPPVRTNPHQLQQVFTNVILNALDAIEEQGTVSIRSFQEDGAVVVEVSDTGLGIPPEHLPRIFDPFFTTKSPGKGTGLGLYLCHQILESLGGEITVASRPGEGSTFSIVLPQCWTSTIRIAGRLGVLEA